MKKDQMKKSGTKRKPKKKDGENIYDFPEIKEKDRSLNTWVKGNPHLAEHMPMGPLLLKPGTTFLSDDVPTEPKILRPEDDPNHPDYGKGAIAFDPLLLCAFVFGALAAFF